MSIFSFEWWQVSTTLLSILADLSNAIVWMVSTGSFISNSSSTCTKLLVTIQSTPITVDITIIFVFHGFFSSLARSWYLSLFVFFQFYPVVSQNCKVHFLVGSLFLLTITRSGHLAEIRCSVCFLKIPEKFVDLIFWVVHIPFVLMVKFKILAQFPVDQLPYPVVSSPLIIIIITSVKPTKKASLERSNLILWSCLPRFLVLANTKMSWSQILTVSAVWFTWCVYIYPTPLPQLGFYTMLV